MAEITQLNRKRGAIKAKLTNFIKFLEPILEAFRNKNEISEETILEVKLRVENMSSLLQEFEETQISIEYLCEEDALAEQYIERDTFMTSYAAKMAKANLILQKLGNHPRLFEKDDDLNSVLSRSHDSISAAQNIKLPTINLPQFTGTYNSWLEYKDTFESLIHLNNSINDVQKYHYLRASLQGDASKIIQSLEFSADNYSIAWKLLCERYNNSRLLVHNHVKALFELDTITKECSSSLRNLIDNIFKHLRALKTLHQPIAHWDTLIIFLISSKLDKVTAREWEKHKVSNEFPTLEDMNQFLKTRADWLETLEINHTSKVQKEVVKDKRTNSRQLSFVSATKKCNFCKQPHLIYVCEEFLKLDVPTRIQKVTELRLCQNCLCTGHQAHYCKYGSCKTCHRKHNTLIHLDIQHPRSALDGQSNTPQVSLSSYTNSIMHDVLLATAVVSVYDAQGNAINIRILLDSASQSNFITAKLCKKLNLEQRPVNIEIVGINTITSNLNSKCDITIKSLFNTFKITIPCLILPKIADNLPSSSFDTSSWNIPQNIHLADPSFSESGEVDLLLGAGQFWNIIRKEQIHLHKTLPILQNTMFGWIVSGSINQPMAQAQCYFSKNTHLDSNLKLFWEIEETVKQSQYSDEDIQCENHFIQNVARDNEGRFVVRIPLKHSPSNLGQSKDRAIKRFLQLEQKLNSKPQLRENYVDFMSEYQQLGHMSISNLSNESHLDYFLPHHGVLRWDSLTTKLRVVFDGSAPSDSGWCVNDLQLTGPAIQNDILSILLRFRQHKYVVSADIAKMYRQILVHPEDRHLQKIVWRSDPNDDILIYTLNTVTYGTASAPYLAIRCLQQLAFDTKSTHPISSQIILRDFYVDDLITGFNCKEEAIKYCHEISNILKAAKFTLRKWNSNSQYILKNIQDESEPVSALFLGDNDNTKTLGIQWQPISDSLTYKIKELSEDATISKRSILSEIAKIFDPLGLASPCIVLAKIIIQKLWLLHLDWDDTIPRELENKWVHFRSNINLLNQLQVKRHVFCDNSITVELHGFCDASQDAYGATVYVRSVDSDNKVYVRLLCAKTKAAPLKCLTIPKLELCSAVMLARLVERVTESLTIKTKIFFWCDSQIVLHWIHTQPKHLQTFVSNRVATIQSISEINSWYYVNTKENPADLASRGVYPDALIKSQLWWNGPCWLSKLHITFPKLSYSNSLSELPEVKKQISSFISNSMVAFPMEEFSSLIKLKRVMGYCLRFIGNSRKQKVDRNFGCLTANELDISMKQLVKISQAQTFSEEIKLLNSDKGLITKHKLISLAPFIDEYGLLRVGGRLKHSQLQYGAKHPLLLSGKHILSRLIFEHEHKILLHAGPQLLLATVRQNYWPTSGMTAAKRVTRNCVRCFKFQPKAITTIMADLPESRVTVMNPFFVTGLDYAGPFSLKDKKGRGCKIIKGYICLFVCFASKAIHLEVVTDLTTESFISVLRRFASRRGKPGHIYSDNATNFVGAKRQLEILYEFLSNSNDEILNCCANENIIWHFIPPNSPHFGGLWESAVKSAKHHLLRMLVNTTLTYEEFYTVVVQVEAILNSRPLYPLSSDPNDLQPITPSHFLIGKPLTAVPDPNLMDNPINKLTRHQLLQHINQGFWTRWSKEYLSHMQQRSKWTTNSTSAIKEGRLVLIKHDNLPPCNWLLGRVVMVHPGDDGVVRVVTVKTLKGLLKRAVSKICPLPLPEKKDN